MCTVTVWCFQSSNLQQPCDTRHAQLNSQHKAPNLQKYKTLGENKKLLSGNKKTNERMTNKISWKQKTKKKIRKKFTRFIRCIALLDLNIKL